MVITNEVMEKMTGMVKYLPEREKEENYGDHLVDIVDRFVDSFLYFYKFAENHTGPEMLIGYNDFMQGLFDCVDEDKITIDKFEKVLDMVYQIVLQRSNGWQYFTGHPHKINIWNENDRFHAKLFIPGGYSTFFSVYVVMNPSTNVIETCEEYFDDNDNVYQFSYLKDFKLDEIERNAHRLSVRKDSILSRKHIDVLGNSDPNVKYDWGYIRAFRHMLKLHYPYAKANANREDLQLVADTLFSLDALKMHPVLSSRVKYCDDKWTKRYKSYSVLCQCLFESAIICGRIYYSNLVEIMNLIDSSR